MKRLLVLCPITSPMWCMAVCVHDSTGCSVLLACVGEGVACLHRPRLHRCRRRPARRCRPQPHPHPHCCPYLRRPHRALAAATRAAATLAAAAPAAALALGPLAALPLAAAHTAAHTAGPPPSLPPPPSLHPFWCCPRPSVSLLNRPSHTLISSAAVTYAGHCDWHTREATQPRCHGGSRVSWGRQPSSRLRR